MILIYSLIIFISASAVILPQWNNYRIYPSTVSQTEVLSVVSPADENIIFVSANTITFNPFFVSEGIYVTTDRGNSWRGSDTCNGSIISYHGGDPGITIEPGGRFILTRRGRLPFIGLYSHYSDDLGKNWSAQKTVTDEDLERAYLINDPVHGRTFAFWVRYSNPYPVNYSYTEDGGQNWSGPASINNPPQRCAGGEAAYYNGIIYVCWAGVSSVSPFTEEYIGFASSSDGGNTWNVKENAFNIRGIQGLLTQKANIRVNGYPRIAVDNSGGSRDGWIYIITTQKNILPAGNDPDVILNISTDGGESWSSGVRVNQDQLNNGKIQYFPAIHVDDPGGLNIIYYDDRNTTSDSTGVFLSRSVDGGITWQEYEISDHRFKPQPIGGLGQGYQGDNIALTSSGNRLFPFWMDNSTGNYQVWTSNIDLSLLSAGDKDKAIPVSFFVGQNYPNPFNPLTTIRYDLPEGSYTSVIIYNALGEVIEDLFSGYKQPGSHEVIFNGKSYPSGLYVCRITSGKNAAAIKMMMMK
jgi:hypothetical protein